jgi:hypothetical protein
MTDTADGAGVMESTGAAASAREDPQRVDQTAAAPVLAVDGFEGPLDWWLEMARAQKIDLAKLSIATLIGSFVTAMETAPCHPGRRPVAALGRLDSDGGDAHRTVVPAVVAGRCAGCACRCRRGRGTAPAAARPGADAGRGGLAGAADAIGPRRLSQRLAGRVCRQSRR